MHLKKIMTTASLLIASISPAKATDIYICQPCPSNTWSNGTSTKCVSCLTTGVSACSSTTGKATSCKPGYKFGKYDCNANCAANCANKSIWTRSICINDCKSSCTTEHILNPTCTKCSAGKYSEGGTDSCKTCSAGSYSSAGASSCSKCSAGKYSTDGASSCSTCPAGYSCPGGTDKNACPAGKYSTDGASSCSTCPKGYYCSGGTDKTICSTGYYSGTGASSCTSCLSTGVSACSSTTGKATSCKAGYGFNSSDGTCTQCSAGYYSAGGTASCSKCPAGSYCPNKGMSAPTNCPSGQYQPNTGATSCKTCSNDTGISCTYTKKNGCSEDVCETCYYTSYDCSSESAKGCLAQPGASQSRCCSGVRGDAYDCNCSKEYYDCSKSGTKTKYYKVSSDRKSCVLDYEGTCS